MIRSIFLTILSYIMVSGCVFVPVPYDTPFNFNRSAVVVLGKDTIGSCVFKSKIEPIRKIWRETGKDLTNNEIDRLKAMAYRDGANAIANIVIENKYNPIGNGDSYSCPNAIYEELKQKQKDSDLTQLVTVVQKP